MALISIIIPSVTDREEYLAQCIASYEKHATAHELEFCVEMNLPTCGRGWNVGASKSTGEFLHFTCDDLEVTSTGWDEVCVESCRRGEIPVPGDVVNLGSDIGDRHLAEGHRISGYGGDITVLPFCSREQWEKIGEFIDGHYFTDAIFSHRCAQLCMPMIVRKGFAFNHHLAQPGRGAGMTESDRMRHDEILYHQAVIKSLFEHPENVMSYNVQPRRGGAMFYIAMDIGERKA